MADTGDAVPEWAPVESLPSSETLLAAFDGRRLVTGSDILDAAFDLVETQRQYRLAFEMLGGDAVSVSAEQFRYAAMEVVEARSDLDVLAGIIGEIEAGLRVPLGS